MSNTIHLSNGEILYDPEKSQFSRSLTITDSVVTDINTTPKSGVRNIDLQGKFAMPGFIDSHLHLTYGASGLGEIDLSRTNSRESFISTLTNATHALPEGSWVVASGWSEGVLGEIPDKSWLHELGEIPVICFSLDLHTALVNDSVLALLDLDHISSMQGGVQINEGLVREDALFNGVSSIIPEVDLQTKISRTRTAINKMNEQGISLVGTMETVNDINGVLAELSNEHRMRFRVMCLDAPSLQAVDLCSSFTNPYLHVTGFKAFLDGSLGSRTAKMYESWIDAEGNGLWAGVASNNSFQKWLACVETAKFSPIVHAIGDQAVGLALDSMANISNEVFPRIEHAQFIAKKDMKKIANRYFGVQPLHLLDDVVMARKAVGKKQFATLHNWRGMVDAGAILSFGSDWPVAAANPIAAMQVAIQNGLSSNEALAMSTCFSADSLRTPLAGRLSIGSYGDIVILDRDPFNCDWNCQHPYVIMTIVGGRVVYEREKSSA